MGVEEVCCTEKTLHLLLGTWKEHSRNRVFAALGETPGPRFDFITEEHDNIGTNLGLFHSENEAVIMTSL